MSRVGTVVLSQRSGSPDAPGGLELGAGEGHPETHQVWKLDKESMGKNGEVGKDGSQGKLVPHFLGVTHLPGKVCVGGCVDREWSGQEVS